MAYTDQQIKDLEAKAKKVRRLIIQMLAKAGSGVAMSERLIP
jgi:transketolase N-terminal domain/subunit